MTSLIRESRSMLARSVLLGLLGATACGGAKLKDLKNPVLSIDVDLGRRTGTSTGSRTVSISVGYDGDCVQMASGMTAEVNGVAIKELEVGGPYTNFDGARSCHLTTFLAASDLGDKISDLDQPVTTVRVSDGKTTFVAEVESLCALRTLALRSPATPTLHAGDGVDLEWQPSGDIFKGEYVDFLRRGSSSPLIARLEADGGFQTNGTHILFTVPTLSASDLGPAEVRFVSTTPSPEDFAEYFARTSRCEGPSRCEATCDDAVRTVLDVTLAQ